MPRIKELSSRAHDLYWQIDQWRIDYDIPEDRIEDALCAAAKLDDELNKLYRDPALRRREAVGAGEIDDDSTSISGSSTEHPDVSP